MWHESKINYVFVFEYDTRHHLDWRQLAEVSTIQTYSQHLETDHKQLPCFFILLLGVFMWFNFNQWGSSAMYIYYPLILLGLSTLILFFPAKVLYYRSRKWLIYSMVNLLALLVSSSLLTFMQWRLILAGLYPVEFRDFYLGDMFCSLTYAMGVSTSKLLFFTITETLSRTLNSCSVSMPTVGQTPDNATLATPASSASLPPSQQYGERFNVFAATPTPAPRFLTSPIAQSIWQPSCSTSLSASTALKRRLQIAQCLFYSPSSTLCTVVSGT